MPSEEYAEALFLYLTGSILQFFPRNDAVHNHNALSFAILPYTKRMKIMLEETQSLSTLVKQ